MTKEKFEKLNMYTLCKKILICPVIILLSLLNGCLTTNLEIDSSNSRDNGKIEAYKLKPMDPLFISFSGIFDQNTLEVIIDERGNINLLHIDKPTKASDLTTSELEQKIEDLYINGEIYRTVSVNVAMTAKAYYVQGEVNEPGKFQLSRGTTLMQAIASARGYSTFANKKNVSVTRQGQMFYFNLKEIEKDPSKDIKIEAGDVINVGTRWY